MSYSGLKQEPDYWGSIYGGKARSNRWDLSNFLNVKIVSALYYVRAQAGRSIRLGQIWTEALDPVFVFIRGTTNPFKFVERRYFEHFGEQVGQSDNAGWLSFRVRKVSVHILKWMRNLTESQCNRFRIGMERLDRGALVTTLARQFWTRCNLAISFYGILWKSELQ